MKYQSRFGGPAQAHAVMHTQRVLDNIAGMKQRADGAAVRLRPHFKTHQSARVGEWFREWGVEAIAVSSVEMAEYFAGAGWRDILIAVPTHPALGGRLTALAGLARVGVLVTDGDTVRRLDLELESDIDVWIEVDAGYHRTGVSVWDVEAIDLVLGELELCRHLRFRGFVLHAGNTYSARDASEVLKIHGQALGAFVGLGRRYRPRYPDLLLSYGDTPSASLATDFEGIDELRPGVFVFHDLMMQQLGACRYSDIALAVYAPVIGVYVQRNEVVVHAGAVHFSKDFLIHPDNGRPMYGLLLDEHTWMPSQGGGYLSKLSQEHGTLSLPEGLAAGYHVGQWVLAAPVHACLTADMFEAYYTTQGTKIERL